MSGDEELDKFLFSIPKSSRKKKEADSKENLPADNLGLPAKKQNEPDLDLGFDPLDLVELRNNQRKIVTWLSRHPHSSTQDLEEATEIPVEDLEALLAELLEEKRIQSEEREGETIYSAPIHGQAGRRLRGFPEDLWKKAGLDDS